MKQRRKELNLSSGELAITLGVSRKSFSQWESPNHELMPRSLKILERWCDELGLSLGEALDETKVPDDEFMRDPQHLKGIRVFYSRYMSEEGFATMIHRLQTMDNDTLLHLSGLINRLSSQVDADKVVEMDRKWSEMISKMKGST